MMSKAKLTKAQAEAIDSVWAAQHWTPQEFIAQHAVNPNRWGAPCDVLNDMELDTLIRAFYIGYEVEQTVEEKLREQYRNWSEDHGFDHAAKCGMETTLDIIGMKVKGINV